MDNNRGFTLLELILTVAISSIVLALIFTYFFYNTKVYIMAHNDQTIQSECTALMERLTVIGKESYDIYKVTSAGAEFPPVDEDEASDTVAYMFLRPVRVGDDVQVEFNRVAQTVKIIFQDGNEEEYNFIHKLEITIPDDSRLRVISLIGRIQTESRNFTTTISMRNSPDDVPEPEAG